MKTKKFSKKLILNKKTVADLNNKEMNDVLGGGTVAYCTVEDPTCPLPHCLPYNTKATFCPIETESLECQ